MEHLNQALRHEDWSWGYFRQLTQDDIKLMDRLLVERQHPLAYEPGTTSDRFRKLHQAKFQF